MSQTMTMLTCQVSGWEHVLLGLFWMYNALSVAILHFGWNCNQTHCQHNDYNDYVSIVYRQMRTQAEVCIDDAACL